MDKTLHPHVEREIHPADRYPRARVRRQTETVLRESAARLGKCQSDRPGEPVAHFPFPSSACMCVYVFVLLPNGRDHGDGCKIKATTVHSFRAGRWFKPRRAKQRRDSEQRDGYGARTLRGCHFHHHQLEGSWFGWFAAIKFLSLAVSIPPYASL